jgi:hypothetical protein
MWGSAVAGVIVFAPAVRLNLIVCVPGSAFASVIAALSVQWPGVEVAQTPSRVASGWSPLSLTTNVVPLAGAPEADASRAAAPRIRIVAAIALFVGSPLSECDGRRLRQKTQ